MSIDKDDLITSGVALAAGAGGAALAGPVGAAAAAAVAAAATKRFLSSGDEEAPVEPNPEDE